MVNSIVSKVLFSGDGNVAIWEVVSKDQKQAIAARYQILNKPNPAYLRIYFKGLNPNLKYRINDSEEIFYGDELMNAGYFVHQILNINNPISGSADFSSRLFVAQAVE
ncbi:hypothetical protein Q757_02255 [Oenococcus alcoholitolerans]|uniref:Glycosyl hydrolase family 36 C-terminal domain-containing protein n=1 Tax=Oenococcus alcoholitolerans TaxID=931074 RepID=A0ABR4XS39_9LACO|nr:hypothetical protein Q757_02255 [Oenococcus alcoholitolerans]